jgi:hypothetical protein
MLYIYTYIHLLYIYIVFFMWFQCHLELPAPSRSEPRLCRIVGSREPRGLNRLSMKNGVWFIIPKHCTVTLINIWGFNLVCRYSSTWDDVCVAPTSSLLPYCGWYLGMVNPLQCGSVAVCVAADPWTYHNLPISAPPRQTRTDRVIKKLGAGTVPLFLKHWFQKL